MRSKQQQFLIICFYVFIDILAIVSAFYLVLLFRPTTVSFPVTLSNLISEANPFRVLFLIWTPLILFFHQSHGLYQTRREQLESFEIIEVIKSVFMSTLTIIVLVYLFKIHDFPRSVMLLNAAVVIAFCSIWRVFKKFGVYYLVQQGYNNFNVVIIGAGKVGTLLAQEISKKPELGIKIVGFLDDYKTGHVGQEQWPVIGKIADFDALVERVFIDKIFITIYHNSDVFGQLLEKARNHDVAVRVIPQGYEWMSQEPVKYNIGIIPVLSYWDAAVNYHMRTKRCFDLIVSGIILVAISPVLCFLALMILIDSRGPVIYKSRRYGCKGKIFHMYKFRSMVGNADQLLHDLKSKNEVDGPIFKIRKDPRVTPFGAFLRKYSLDELPQIFNVIKGDMSLVGPRPLPIDQIEKEDLQQLKRLEVRPGITGLWQVRGRSDVSFGRLIKWDIWYINNWSFGLDLYILAQTIPVVLKGKGAY